MRGFPSPTKSDGIDWAHWTLRQEDLSSLVFKTSGICDQSRMTSDRWPRHLTSERWTGLHLRPKVNVN